MTLTELLAEVKALDENLVSEPLQLEWDSSGWWWVVGPLLTKKEAVADVNFYNRARTLLPKLVRVVEVLIDPVRCDCGKCQDILDEKIQAILGKESTP